MGAVAILLVLLLSPVIATGNEFSRAVCESYRSSRIDALSRERVLCTYAKAGCTDDHRQEIERELEHYTFEVRCDDR